ncbi:MAG: FAD-dependent thymidylate synthase [Thermodesulfobacteriota bacterium]|nr:FAD-dependent thymidylate synthase [Thermodesulfobacteriota bacterium]
MKVIDPYFEILHMADPEDIYTHLELAARTCYKSEDKIDRGTAHDLLRRLLKTGHESVIEHISISVRIVCDRGISHEIVRHRLCSFSQESTRYANYSREKFGREITVIRPFFWEVNSDQYLIWKEAMEACEQAYLALLARGAKAQEARSVLPNSLKTDLIVTANIREWMHIFNLRCSLSSHPQMRQIMVPLLKEFYNRIPVFFESLHDKYEKSIESFPALN